MRLSARLRSHGLILPPPSPWLKIQSNSLKSPPSLSISSLQTNSCDLVKHPNMKISNIPLALSIFLTVTARPQQYQSQPSKTTITKGPCQEQDPGTEVHPINMQQSLLRKEHAAQNHLSTSHKCKKILEECETDYECCTNSCDTDFMGFCVPRKPVKSVRIIESDGAIVNEGLSAEI